MALLVIFGVVAVSRCLFAERSFWEWDDIMFANALHRFNLQEHVPHPPGYPLFIGMGRLLNFFLHDDLKSLVFINVFFGSLLIFPLYFFYRYFASTLVALWAAILSLFNWVVWVYSETALSDLTSLFWVFTSLAFLYRYEENRYFLPGMISMGIAIGFSPQKALFGVLLLPLLLWWKVRSGARRCAATGLAGLVGTCLAWVVPLILASGGPAAYWDVLKRHGRESAAYIPGYMLLRDRMSFADFVTTKFISMWGDAYFALLILGLVILGIVRYGPHRRPGTIRLLAATFIPWMVVDFFSLNLYYPRYQMYTILLSTLFAAYGLLTLWPRYPAWRNLFAPVLLAGVAMFSGVWAFSVVHYLHTQDSVPVRLFDYIRRHLNPKTDVLICDPRLGLFPHQYLPDFALIYQDGVDEKTELAGVRDKNWYYIGNPAPGAEYPVAFRVENDRAQRIAVYNELALGRINVLFSKDFKFDLGADTAVYRLTTPAAHCYLKNTGRTKVLSIESVLTTGAPESIEVGLDLNGTRLYASTQSNGRFDRFFVLSPPPEPHSSTGVLTFRLNPCAQGTGLAVQALHWLDIELNPQALVQRIDFNSGDEVLMVAGWSQPETDGAATFAWSDGDYSTLKVSVQPRGVYELTFRAYPVARDDTRGPPQAVSICLGGVCGPEIELTGEDWQTYTLLLLAPAAERDPALTFRYRFTYSPTFPDGSREERALGVAFDYVALKYLGTRLP